MIYLFCLIYLMCTTCEAVRFGRGVFHRGDIDISRTLARKIAHPLGRIFELIFSTIGAVSASAKRYMRLIIEESDEIFPKPPLSLCVCIPCFGEKRFGKLSQAVCFVLRVVRCVQVQRPIPQRAYPSPPSLTGYSLRPKTLPLL